jgi:YD repeat-containing protein
LTAKIDAKNQKTEYDYDDAGRLLEIRYLEAANHENPIKSVTFSYDAAGEKLRVAS